MRQSHICPKCHFNRILFVAQVPDIQEHVIEPMHAAFSYLGPAFFGGDRTEAVGRMTSCICKRCGFTELYTTGVEQIPIDGRYVHELVGPEAEGPYR